jgi:hypothetical protein
VYIFLVHGAVMYAFLMSAFFTSNSISPASKREIQTVSRDTTLA